MITQKLNTSRFGLGIDCAVCGFSNLMSLDGPRHRIVMSIMETLHSTGQFSPGGLQQFWNQFRHELCEHCQSKLDTLESSKGHAIALLEEAVRLDSKNDAAKKNLAALRSQL